MYYFFPPAYTNTGGIFLFIFRRKLLLIFLIIIIGFILPIIIFINKILYPVFFTIAEAEARQTVNEIINQAVEEEISSIEYEDLIKYKCDNEGNIILLQQNTKTINHFSSQVALNIQKSFRKIKELKIAVPMGRFLGLEILAGLGPVFEVKVIPGGFISTPGIIDEFQSAGINQTRHKLYLSLNLEIFLSAPFSREKFMINSIVPVIEVTILGRVPEIYLGFNENGISNLIRGN